MPVTSLLPICQVTAFSIAVTANSLLLYMIKQKAGASLGTYRVMMISFSIYAIVYAFIEILTMPTGENRRPVSARIATLLCIAMLAAQFVFRYIAVCKPHKLYYFDGFKIYSLFIPPVTLFVIWTLSIYFNFHSDQVKRDFFRNVAWELYGENIDEIAFMGPLCFVREKENGKVIFRVFDLLGMIISCTIMTICLITCVICASKTYRNLNDTTIHTSARTRSLNKQLFWTLGLQTLLPLITQYIPVGTMFIVPLFELEFGRMGNFVGAFCSLYPAMDPIIAIVTIEEFRKFVLRKRSGSLLKASTVMAATF